MQASISSDQFVAEPRAPETTPRGGGRGATRTEHPVEAAVSELCQGQASPRTFHCKAPGALGTGVVTVHSAHKGLLACVYPHVHLGRVVGHRTKRAKGRNGRKVNPEGTGGQGSGTFEILLGVIIRSGDDRQQAKSVPWAGHRRGSPGGCSCGRRPCRSPGSHRRGT